jgi:hypothetical protein
MTSGRRRTESEVDAILRLAGYRTGGGSLVHTETTIAELLRMDRRVVHDVIWHAAAQWGKLTRWHAPLGEES